LGTPGLIGCLACGSDPNGQREGVENAVFPRYLMSVTQDLHDANGVLVPAAESTYRERLANDSADDPIANCQPAGSPRVFSFMKPTKKNRRDAGRDALSP
jgi:hypothetical protein